MKRLLSLLIALSLIVAFTSRAGAVDFQEELRKLAQDNAVGYVGPFATAFGTAMNSGLYHTAKPHAFLGFDAGIKISMVQVSDEDLTFNFKLPAILTVNVPNYGNVNLKPALLYPDTETPTMFGEDQGKTLLATDGSLETALLDAGLTSANITDLRNSGEYNNVLGNINATPLTTPPGLGVDVVPLFMPQASVGLPFKTEVLVRFVPETDIEKFGKIKLLGIGVKHSISQWIPVPLLGLDITGQYATQSLEIGPVTSNNTAFNLQVSRRFGFMLASLTPYAGFGLESSTIKVDYTIEGTGNPALDGVPVAFDIDGDNSSRLTAGARLQLLLFTINADVNVGEYTAYSLGVGVTIR